VRRWKLLGALAVGLVALVAAGVFVMRPQRFIWDKYVRIEKGMTRVEVEAVFGPPGNFSGEDVVYEIESAQRVSWIPTGASCDGDIEGWLYDEARVVVFFDDAGRAIEKAYAPRSRNGPVGDYLRRVRRAWRKW
jgi:hypothetical protein